MNGLVGFKPTLGLVSRTHVVPISHSQDTPGPMARSVRDYAAGLSTSALSGLRVAVLRPDVAPELAARFDAAIAVLRAAGAALVTVERPSREGLGAAEQLVLHTELKADLDAYLATTPPAVTARTLDQVIAFNAAHASAEMPFFGQETFEAAARTTGLDDPAYKAARALSLRRAGAEGIDAMLKAANATVLVQPAYGAAWLSDPVNGDQYDGPSASQLAAVAGYPNLTVPMGLVQGLPVGLSFVATRGGDAVVLGAGYAYEQRARRRTAPLYRRTADIGPGLDPRR
jgi:amidase